MFSLHLFLLQVDQVTVNVTVVKCAGCGSFDDGETCCLNLQGSWMCYPIPWAVCCHERDTRCPPRMACI